MRRRSTATTVAVVYLVAAVTWILISTPLVAAVEPWLPMSAATAELVKGVGFVAVTATLLWVVLRHSDRRLSRIAARFRRLADGMPLPIYVLDPNLRRHVYVNPAFDALMAELDLPAAATPSGIAQRAVVGDRASIDIDRRLERDHPHPFVVGIPDSDGAPRRLQFHEHHAVGEEGQPLLQGLIVDVTAQDAREAALEGRLRQQRETTRELKQLHEMQAAFLQAVSHELRTPLTVITGSAELLQRRHHDLDDATEEELRARLVANAAKLSRLLTDLLDVDRLTRGVIEPRRRRVEIRALIDRTVETMDLSGHSLTIDGDEVWAEVDAAQIERVVENLVTNAVRHTPPGTAISVAAHEDDEGCEITVEDSGPGLPADRDLFAPFERGETWAPSPGAGIGLTLVKNLVELHGGRVTAHDNVGGGAMFRVFLPTYPPTRERERATTRRGPSSGALEP